MGGVYVSTSIVSIFSPSLYGDIRLGAEAEPITTVANCVNVVTGEFFQVDTDLALDGPAPLQFTRCFDSGCSYESWMGYRWGSQLPLSIAVSREQKNNTLEAEIPVREGTSYPFRDKRDQAQFLEMHLNPAIFKLGLTNLAEGGISGQHNIKNFRAFITAEGYQVHLGDGTKRFYENHKFEGLGDCRLYEEQRPNTQKVLYSYEKGSLKKIQVTNAAKNIVFNTLEFKGHENHFKIKARNGYQSEYKMLPLTYERGIFKKDKKRQVLSEVKRTGKPTVTYNYNRHVFDKYGKYLLGRIEYPKNRFLEISYRKEKVFKVSELRAPVGDDGMSLVTHRFEYHKLNNTDHYAEVHEPYGKRTRYIYHGDNKRLQSIEYYDNHIGLHHAERFIWEEKIDLEKRKCGWLKFKGLGGKSTLLNGTEYAYDEAGNVIQETFWGNLTGKAPKEFRIDDEGNWDRTTENYTIERTFSQDGLNLLLSEKRPEGIEIRYQYQPETNLLLSQKIIANGRIEKRVFHSYDKNAMLIKTIEDDGSREEPDILDDVAVRKITQYILVTNSDSAAFGKPQEILLSAYNCVKNKECQLKRSVLTYDAAGRVIQEAIYDNLNYLKYVLKTVYDEEGRIIEQTDPVGGIVQYTYDQNFNKTSEEIVGTGKITFYDYDFANRLIKQEEKHEDGPTVALRHYYNHASHRIATDDIYGNRTTYKYNAWGQETEQEQPLVYGSKGNITPLTKKTYDRAGRIHIEKDAEGNKTHYYYDARSQVTEIKYADGSKEFFRYKLNGKIAKKKDRLGTWTCYEYNPLGQVTKETVKKGKEPLKQTHYLYKGDLLLAEIDPMGYRTDYAYDFAGRKASETRYIGTESISTCFEYDSLGRLWKIHHPEQVLVTEYDNLDRLIEERTETPLGEMLRKTRYGYDLQGNRTHAYAYSSPTDYSLQVVHYNSYRMPCYEKDALGYEKHYVYDLAYVNNLSQKVLKKTITRPDGTLVIEVLDALGRLSTREEQTPFQHLLTWTHFIYDAEGNTVLQNTCRQSNGILLGEHKIEWHYDSMGRVVNLTEQGKSRARYTYDAAGHVKTLIKPDGTILHYSYDILGRLIEQSSSDQTIHYKYTYDLNDRLVEVHDLISNTLTIRAHDALDRIIHEEQGNGLALDFTYDTLGRVKSCQAAEVNFSYTYDAVQLLTATRHNAEGKPLYTHTYLETDLQGRQKRSQLIGSSGELKCTYDLLGRYTKLSAYGWTQQIVYDCMGNPKHLAGMDVNGGYLLSMGYDWMNQLTQEGSTNYSYDTLYNRLSKNQTSYSINEYNQIAEPDFEYNLNGSLIRYKDKHFTYDALERLIKVKTVEGTFQYSYDSFGRRLSKKTPKTMYQYLYHGDREIAAYEKKALKEFRLLGRGAAGGIGSTVALEIQNKTYAALSDHRGALVHLIPANQKSLPASQRFNAFGELPTERVSPWGYAGKRHDPETEFVYFGQRYYIPELGRWLTQDPLYFEDGPNLYAYVHNRPLQMVDPYGLFTTEWNPYESQENELKNMAFCEGFMSSYNTSIVMNVNNLGGKIFNPLQTYEEFSQRSPIDSSRFLGETVGEVYNVYSLARTVISSAVTGIRNTLRSKLISEEIKDLAIKEAKNISSKGSSTLRRQSVIKNTINDVTHSEMPSLDSLSKAGQVMDRNGLTKAGRALQKHGSRPNSHFPKAPDRLNLKNIEGQFHLDDILTNPKSKVSQWEHRGFGKIIDIEVPSHGGARFDYCGNFIGFLE